MKEAELFVDSHKAKSNCCKTQSHKSNNKKNKTKSKHIQGPGRPGEANFPKVKKDLEAENQETN